MTFILFGRSPTWWPSGDTESSRFVGLPNGQAACCLSPQRRYRCGRKTVPRTVAVVWTWSGGRGCRPIRSQSNWSLFRECPIFGCVGLTSRNVRFAAVSCNDRFAASQGATLRITCLLRFALAQGVVDRLPFSPPLFGVGVEPWMDRTACCTVHDPGLRRQPARVGCIDSGSMSNQGRRRQMTDIGETVA